MLGNELNMGTTYDFFGVEAFSDNLNFSDDILQNRQLLHSTLQKYNFIPIRTEWWHLSIERQCFILLKIFLCLVINIFLTLQKNDFFFFQNS
jgi:D-alanyl-D-alanine dipeptidase